MIWLKMVAWQNSKDSRQASRQSWLAQMFADQRQSG
jgi:hypothetical protein